MSSMRDPRADQLECHFKWKPELNCAKDAGKLVGTLNSLVESEPWLSGLHKLSQAYFYTLSPHADLDEALRLIQTAKVSPESESEKYPSPLNVKDLTEALELRLLTMRYNQSDLIKNNNFNDRVTQAKQSKSRARCLLAKGWVVLSLGYRENSGTEAEAAFREAFGLDPDNKDNFHWAYGLAQAMNIQRRSDNWNAKITKYELDLWNLAKDLLEKRTHSVFLARFALAIANTFEHSKLAFLSAQDARKPMRSFSEHDAIDSLNRTILSVLTEVYRTLRKAVDWNRKNVEGLRQLGDLLHPPKKEEEAKKERIPRQPELNGEGLAKELIDHLNNTQEAILILGSNLCLGDSDFCFQNGLFQLEVKEDKVKALYWFKKALEASAAGHFWAEMQIIELDENDHSETPEMQKEILQRYDSLVSKFRPRQSKVAQVELEKGRFLVTCNRIDEGMRCLAWAFNAYVQDDVPSRRSMSLTKRNQVKEVIESHESSKMKAYSLYLQTFDTFGQSDRPARRDYEKLLKQAINDSVESKKKFFQEQLGLHYSNDSLFNEAVNCCRALPDSPQYRKAMLSDMLLQQLPLTSTEEEMQLLQECINLGCKDCVKFACELLEKILIDTTKEPHIDGWKLNTDCPQLHDTKVYEFVASICLLSSRSDAFFIRKRLPIQTISAFDSISSDDALVLTECNYNWKLFEARKLFDANVKTLKDLFHLNVYPRAERLRMTEIYMCNQVSTNVHFQMNRGSREHFSDAVKATLEASHKALDHVWSDFCASKLLSIEDRRTVKSDVYPHGYKISSLYEEAKSSFRRRVDFVNAQRPDYRTEIGYAILLNLKKPGGKNELHTKLMNGFKSAWKKLSERLNVQPPLQPTMFPEVIQANDANFQFMLNTEVEILRSQGGWLVLWINAMNEDKHASPLDIKSLEKKLKELFEDIPDAPKTAYDLAHRCAEYSEVNRLVLLLYKYPLEKPILCQFGEPLSAWETKLACRQCIWSVHPDDAGKSFVKVTENCTQCQKDELLVQKKGDVCMFWFRVRQSNVRNTKSICIRAKRKGQAVFESDEETCTSAHSEVELALWNQQNKWLWSRSDFMERLKRWETRQKEINRPAENIPKDAKRSRTESISSSEIDLPDTLSMEVDNNLLTNKDANQLDSWVSKNHSKTDFKDLLRSDKNWAESLSKIEVYYSHKLHFLQFDRIGPDGVNEDCGWKTEHTVIAIVVFGKRSKLEVTCEAKVVKCVEISLGSVVFIKGTNLDKFKRRVKPADGQRLLSFASTTESIDLH